MESTILKIKERLLSLGYCEKCCENLINKHLMNDRLSELLFLVKRLSELKNGDR